MSYECFPLVSSVMEDKYFFRYMRSMILGSLTKNNAISDKIIMNFHVDKCVYRVYFNL